MPSTKTQIQLQCSDTGKFMSWENLSKEENIRVGEIMKKHSIENFNAYISFHTKSEKITIDGNLTNQELRCLSEISEYLGYRYQGQNH